MNAAHSELMEVMPQQADGRILMYKKEVDMPMAELARRDRPVQEEQWKHAAQTLIEQTEDQKQAELAKQKAVLDFKG